MSVGKIQENDWKRRMQPGASFQIFTYRWILSKWAVSSVTPRSFLMELFVTIFSSSSFLSVMISEVSLLNFAAAVWLKWLKWGLTSSLFFLSLSSSLNPGHSACLGLGKQLVDLLSQLLLPRSKQCVSCRNTARQNLHPSCPCLPIHYSPSISLKMLQHPMFNLSAVKLPRRAWRSEDLQSSNLDSKDMGQGSRAEPLSLQSQLKARKSE